MANGEIIAEIREIITDSTKAVSQKVCNRLMLAATAQLYDMIEADRKERKKRDEEIQPILKAYQNSVRATWLLGGAFVAEVCAICGLFATKILTITLGVK